MRPVSVLPASADVAAEEIAADDPIAALAALSNQAVKDRVTTWAGRMAAGEAQLLLYVGELDERVAWADHGVLSCAHWLSWRCGMGAKVASDRVRVAKALRKLPKTFAAFAAGRLSFTQVRAITRVADAADEDRFLRIAKAATGQQLERLVRGIRRAQKLAIPEADRPTITTPRLRVGYDEDGSIRLTVHLSAEDGAQVLAALEAARVDVDAEKIDPAKRAKSSAEDSQDRHRAAAGTGFLALCRSYVQHRGDTKPTKARRDRSRLTPQVDPLSGWARLPDGELLPPGAITLNLPGAVPLRPIRPTDLTLHDAGRKLREASPALRELLGIVDGERCRFPSCTRKRKLHAHHVREWSLGGRTDLVNLVLLCGRHHTLVHADGYRLALHPITRALIVTTDTGIALPHHPPLPWRPAAELDPTQIIDQKTLPNTTYDRLNLHYAVEVMMQFAA